MDLKLKVSWTKFLVLIFIFTVPSFAIDINDVNKTSLATGIIKQDARAYPKIAFNDATKTFFDRNNLTLLLLAGGGSIALHDTGIDHHAAEHFEENGKMPKGLDNFTDIVGNPGTHFAITGVWYALSAKNKDDVNIQRSWIMLRALGVTGATTLALKGIVHNDTPNGQEYAWPSGHTSSSFCFAAVLDEFYGWKIGIPAYIGAGFVGYRMMESGDHWASDVLFGGVLGYVVGHAIAGQNKDLAFAGFKVEPMVSSLHQGPTAGIVLARRF